MGNEISIEAVAIVVMAVRFLMAGLIRKTKNIALGLLASAFAIAPMPLKSQEGSAVDLGDVLSVSLKDAVKFNWGF